jgi:hypothetical protein
MSVQNTTQLNHRAKSRLSPASTTRRSINRRLQKKNNRNWPVLFLSLACFYLVWYILHQVRPAQIQHLPVYNSYAPLTLTWALGWYFLTRFFTKKHITSLIISLWLTIPLVLKLQNVILDTTTVVVLSLAMLVLLIVNKLVIRN